MKRIFLLFSVFCLSSFIYAQGEPTDKQVTPETRNLYLNLQRISKKGVLIGHQDDLFRGHGWRNEPGRSDIKELVGEYPAILGSDIGKIEFQSDVNWAWQRFDEVTKNVQQFYRQGGIVSLAWHMNNPVSPEQPVKSTQDSTIYYLFSNPQLLERYHTWMDNAAEYLLSLKGDNGEQIPILLRLFHEHTGSWFWWGKSHCTPEEYIKLWRYTVDYLRNTRQVHNILTVYCPDVFDSAEEYLERYPGDKYVDILGFDLYDKDNWQSEKVYVQKGKRMVKILTEINKDKKKVMAMAETGLNKIANNNWWTQHMMAVLKKSGLAYALIWGVGTNNYWSPAIGHPSAPDFKKFHQKKWLLFETDVRKEKVYQSPKE